MEQEEKAARRPPHFPAQGLQYQTEGDAKRPSRLPLVAEAAAGKNYGELAELEVEA